MRTFDSIVIGGGQAGPFLAVKLAASGENVAVVERAELGGTCVNRGCTPTKTLRKSARVAYLARRAAEFGVQTGPVTVDFPAAMARMRERVETSRNGLAGWLGSVDGLTLLQGAGVLGGHTEDGSFRVHIGEETVVAKRVFLNTGTRPFVPPVDGLRDHAITNVEVLQLTELPDRLIVLGGSYIGLELGQIFQRLGSQVTVVEVSPRLAAREDEDISEALRKMLEDEGMEVITGTGVQTVRRDGTDLVATLSDGRELVGTHLLAATGRAPNTGALGLETVGLQTDARGYIATNGRLETEVANLYALGDINGRGAFTHTSYQDHEIVAENLLNDGNRSADDRVLAYAMFTDPPLGHVGIHEAEARALAADGRAIEFASLAMANVSRAKEESETTGKLKFWIDADSGVFLGATILGIQADEIIQAINLVMASGGTVGDVLEALPVHPTVTEFLPTILSRRAPLT
jgi:pyruvate/2-oxoglutarate dehydrogenase complex dihydrolipoamide dehydrogenase (E3) component